MSESKKEPTWGELEDMSPEEAKAAIGPEAHGKLIEANQRLAAQVGPYLQRLANVAKKLAPVSPFNLSELEGERKQARSILDVQLEIPQNPAYATNEKLDTLADFLKKQSDIQAKQAAKHNVQMLWLTTAIGIGTVVVGIVGIALAG